MEQKTDMAGVSPVDRLRQIGRNNRVLLELAGSAVSGFLMANSFIFGGVSPFGVALPAALEGKHSYCAALGALAGYVISSNFMGNIRYIAALLFVVIFKWVLEHRVARASTPGLCVIIALVAMSAANCAFLVAKGDPTLYDIMLAFAEIGLASGTAYFFSRSLLVLDLGVSGASKPDISCLVVSLAIILMGFSGCRIGGVSMGRVLAVTVILFCARYGGEAAGAVAGVTAGIAIGLTGRDYSYVVSAYSFGGLVAGVFSKGGKLASAASFVIVNALTALFVSENVDVYTALIEIFIASVAFMLVPGSWSGKLRTLGMGAVRQDNSSQLALRGKLKGIAVALRDISTTTHEVSQRLGKMEHTGPEALHNEVSERICKRCGSRTSCWQFHYNDTTEAMSQGVRILRQGGSLNRETAPKYLKRSCCKLDVLLTEFNTAFRDSVARAGVQRKVSQVRSVVTDQFDGMATMLEEISGELCSMKLLEQKKTLRVKEYFQREKFQTDRLLCYTGEDGRMRVELTIPAYQLARLNKSKAALTLCDLLDAEFDLPQVTVRETEAHLCFSEKAVCSIEIGAYQIASGGARLCGDAYDYIRERLGKAHLVLSDGMGSGGGAAVDSSMASGLITKLLSVGVGHDAALKMVNSALLIKSGEESLATIDVCTLDLFTGKVEFYKAGAAPSYVLRNGRAGYVESTSLPAGILRGVAFEKSSVGLKAGDIVVLVSDGVTATGTDWVASELEQLVGSDVQRICEKLAMTAKLRREDGREDDITVIAAALKKGGS